MRPHRLTQDMLRKAAKRGFVEREGKIVHLCSEDHPPEAEVLQLAAHEARMYCPECGQSAVVRA